MSVSLACKYRPKSFEECVGQPVVVSVLSRQIATKTFKSAYLFVGASGCGKTSVARIMASEINNRQSDPIEIDAASNNGIDNVRAIISDARQTSLDSDYKVYILDECHAFSNQAWQALLKLIEEPPYNTIFIFCTTNPDKIPDTIMTRVQRFDFNKISNKDIVDRLEFILNEEIIKVYDKSALERIAYLSNGLMREAISLMDKCIAYGDLTLENVEKVLGLLKYDYLFNLLNAFKSNDSEKAFKILDTIKLSVDYKKLFDIFLDFLINCAIYSKTNNFEIVNIPDKYISDVDTTIDYYIYIDTVFKYRQLLLSEDAEQLFKILIMELCRKE